MTRILPFIHGKGNWGTRYLILERGGMVPFRWANYSHNLHMWLTDNPCEHHETSLHCQKVGIWCAMLGKKKCITSQWSLLRLSAASVVCMKPTFQGPSWSPSYRHLTWLIAQEDFTEFSCCKSSRSTVSSFNCANICGNFTAREIS